MKYESTLIIATTAVTGATFALSVGPAEAKSCSELRSLCWTMRTDKSDCAGPYQRCLKSGVFVRPLGRRFVATSR